MRGEQIEQMCEREDQTEADRQRRVEECAKEVIDFMDKWDDLYAPDIDKLREILSRYIH